MLANLPSRLFTFRAPAHLQDVGALGVCRDAKVELLQKALLHSLHHA
jgi:hypothetical protein